MREWEQAGQRNHRKLGGQRERGWGAAAVQQLQQRQPHPPLFIIAITITITLHYLKRTGGGREYETAALSKKTK